MNTGAVLVQIDMDLERHHCLTRYRGKQHPEHVDRTEARMWSGHAHRAEPLRRIVDPPIKPNGIPLSRSVPTGLHLSSSAILHLRATHPQKPNHCADVAVLLAQHAGTNIR